MASKVVEIIRSYELPKKPIWSKPGKLVLLLVIFAVILAMTIALTREAGEGEATGILWLFATKKILPDAEPLGDTRKVDLQLGAALADGGRRVDELEMPVAGPRQ